VQPLEGNVNIAPGCDFEFGVVGDTRTYIVNGSAGGFGYMLSPDLDD
jgi:hypothetical protein